MSQALAKRITMLEQSQSIKTAQHITWSGNSFTVNAQHIDDKRIYIPNKTGELFHSDDSLVRLIVGPYGSGKSTICMAEIVRRACQMPVWCYGIRRSKWLIIRNTSGELVTTTLQTWLYWFGNLGDVQKRQKPVLTYEHRFNDGHGIVELEVIFLALDREDDLTKLKSMEITGAYVNEASEIPRGTIPHLIGRRRYPAAKICPSYWSGIIADTNAPDTDHYIYDIFEVKKPEGYKIYHQPPGLIKDDQDKWVYNPDADNMVNLKPDYYLSMAEGQNEEFVKVFCLGQYGTVILGKRVYPEYNDDLHSVDNLQILKGLPVHIGWDFGLTPACIMIQVTDRGQIRVFKEFIGEDMGILQFYESVVHPYISSELKGMTIEHSVGDPSGAVRKDTDESTCIDTLNACGIKTFGAKTNAILPRIESVKYYLNRMIDGRPAFLVSRIGAPKLRKGFLGDYHYRRLAVAGAERYQEIPNKNGASHPHDACQYICLEFYDPRDFNNKKEMNKNIIEAVYNPVFTI